MEFQPLEIPGLVLIVPKVFEDPRGFFMEAYKKSAFAAHGIDWSFCQENHSRSSRGVLRGLHYQLPPMEQGKLVRVVRGALLDVAVDIRQGSPTYGQHAAVELTAENRHTFWIPPGFAHGFVALEDGTEMLYHVTNEYSPKDDRGIHYRDAALNIDWPLSDGEVLVSEKDSALPSLEKAENTFQF